MMPTADDLRAHEAHAGHPQPLTGRCGIGVCRGAAVTDHDAGDEHAAPPLPGPDGGGHA